MKLNRSACSKGVSFLLLAFVFFVSCKKNNNPVSGKEYLVFAYLQDSIHLQYDSLIYDASGRIAQIQQWKHDTVSGQTSLTNNATYLFTFSGSSTFPASYTVHSVSGTTVNADQTHMLYYDNANRIIKDSVLNSVIDSTSSFNYNYKSDSILYNVFANTDSGYRKVQSDTLTISGSGNVTTVVSQYPASRMYKKDTVGINYISYANPFYNSNISNSFGILLSKTLSIDFISPNLFVSKTFISYTAAIKKQTIYNYQWIMDGQGNVVSGLSLPAHYIYTFHYSN